MGLDPNSPDLNFKAVVDRAVMVQALTDEDKNYQQKWRITWNLSDAQSPKIFKGDGAVPYDGSGFDDMSNPDYSLMVSQDLTILTDSAHTPQWTVYNRQDPSNIVDTFQVPLWKTQRGDVHKVTNQYKVSNTLKNMYYIGQYRDADGNAAKSDWQNYAKACLAGSDTARNDGVATVDSPCGDYVEWLNGSGKSFAMGQTDITDFGTRYVDGKSYDRSFEQFTKFARQIGGVQAFEWNTGSFDKSSNNLGQVVSVEFTTQRTPWAGNGNENVHRTFVAGHYKGNYRSYLYQGTQFKYVEVPEKDSDGDGLYDRFENGIGTCAYPLNSDEYNASPYCQGVKDPQDTDGDGIKDGVEVTSTTPKATPTGFKIEGTDPTVAPQKPGNPDDPTGTTRGERVTGTTKPYMTLELWDLTGNKLLASTVADDKGNYTLEVGKALARMDGKQTNIYGNNIKFADDEDLASRTPQYYDLPDSNLASPGDMVALRVWSDGMDPLGTTNTTRPHFETPTGVLASKLNISKIVAEDPAQLTDGEKQQIKDNVANAGISDPKVGDDGTVAFTGSDGHTYTIPRSETVNSTSAVAATATLNDVPDSLTAGDTVSDASVSATTEDGQPAAGATVYAKVPGRDDLVPLTVGKDGSVALPEFTPSATDNTVSIYPDNDASSTPLASATITVNPAGPSAGTSEISAPAPGSVPVSDGSTDEGKTSMTVTLKDAHGNLITDADNLSVTRTDGKALNDPEIVNNGDGTYTVTVSSKVAGTTPLQITAGETVIGQTDPVTFEPGEVDLSQSTTEVTRNGASAGNGETNIVAVTLKDKYGNPTDKGGDQSSNIGFDTVPANWNTKVPAPVTTKTGTGTYEIAVQGNQQSTDSANVQLRGQELPNDAKVTLEFKTPPIDASMSTVEVTCPEKGAVADGEQACTVTVTLKDGRGEVIEDDRSNNVAVAIEQGEGSLSGLTWDPKNHVYTGTLTSTKAGDVVVTATAGGKNLTGTDEADRTAHFVPGPLAQVTNPQGIPGVGDTPAGKAGDTVTNATVKVFDKNGNPLQPGTEVYVTVPGVDEPVKATVGSDGIAKLDPFTPTKTTGENGTAGDGTVVVYPDKDTATAGDPSKGVDTGETPVINAGAFDPASSTVDVTAGPKTVGDSHTVTVSLTDANGNPITGDAAQAALDTLEVSATDGTTSATVGTGWTPVEGKPGQYTTTVTSDKPGSFPVTVTSGEEQTPLKQGENTTATFATGGPANAAIDGLTPTTVGGTIDNATVTVTDAKGNPVAAGIEVYVKIGAGDPVKATVGENGTVTLDGKDGQPGPITVTKDDVATGSVPVVVTSDPEGKTQIGTGNVPVKASTPTDVVAVKHADGTMTVTATVPNAKKGETVTLKDQAGNEIGTGTVKEDGTVTVTVPADKAGDVTSVTVTAGSDATASEASQPAEVRDAVATPDEPTVTNKTDGTTEVAVHVDAPEGTTVTVTGPDGKPHTAKVDGNGNATVTLDPGLKAGDKVTVTAGDAPLTSAEVTGTAVDQTATPTDVVAVKKTDGSATVTGKAEPGSAVTVKVGDKEYPATTGEDGTFEVPVPGGIPSGQTPSVTVTGKGKATSEPATATSQTQLDTPTVSALTSPDGTTTTVSGKATPGQKVTVTAGGKTYTPEVKADGSYSFTTDEPLANGTELTAVAGEGLTASESGEGTANTQTATPTAKAVTSEDGKTTTVSGTAEPGATVTVTGPDGTKQTVTAREDGTYSVDLTPALKDGDSVKVTAQNGAEVPSEPATATAGTRLPAPTGVTAVTDPDGTTTTVTGTSTAPKDTPVTVTYTGTDGKEHTAQGTVGEDGTIKVDLTEPPAKDGTPVTVTVGSEDTQSKPAEGVTAQTKTATPTVDSVVTDPAGTTDPKTTVSGTAKPGAKVTVKVGDKVVGETTANEDGSYTVPVSPALADKTVVTVTATDNGKVTSFPATGTAVTKTAAPTVDSVVTDPAGKGTTVTGTAESGSTVTVTGPDGKEHTTTAGEDGTYSVTIEPGLKDGETVTVTAGKDGQAGSAATTGTATTQVATPTDVATTTDPATGATTVTGKSDAKPGTTVTITDKAGNVVGTGTVNEDGTFSITTDPAQPGGTELNVTVGDKPVTSDPATVTVKYPAATDGVAIADPAAGTTKVDGKATGAADGTPVTVRNAKGEVIGTGEVKDGKFTVTAKPALPSGAVITVTVGTPNTSAASDLLKVTVQAIPAKPGNVDATVTDDGKGVTVTGTTDAGNGVTVTEKDGTVHQTVADKDGHFAVTVPGAKAGDELTVRVVRDGLVSEAVTVTAHAADAGKATTGQGKPTVVGSLAKTGAAVGGLALLALASIALGAAVLRRREQA